MMDDVPIALVTGASRRVGRGVAIGLVDCGYKVYVTGRSIESADLPPSVIRVACDHTRDEDTAGLFRLIEEAGEGLDILVNSAWGGYERMSENGQFTWPLLFWQQPAHRWSSMIDAGVRAAFVHRPRGKDYGGAASQSDCEYQFLGGTKVHR